MHRLRWDDLQFVHAVAEHGSLSAASRALGVNHATVLRRIALLEAANEVQLFDRSSDGYRLRPEGRALLASLKLMDHASARIQRSLVLTSKGIDGTFRLSTTDAIACLLMPKYLTALRATHPNTHIEIDVSNDPVDMSLSGAELLIRPGSELPADLSGIHAGTVGFGVFSSADYLKTNTGRDASAQKWLGVAPTFAQSTAGEWQAANNQTRFDFSADSFLALASLAAEGLGLAMLPVFVGNKTPLLVRVSEFSRGPVADIWVATHKEFRQQTHIEALLEFFARAIRTDAELN